MKAKKQGRKGASAASDSRTPGQRAATGGASPAEAIRRAALPPPPPGTCPWRGGVPAVDGDRASDIYFKAFGQYPTANNTKRDRADLDAILDAAAVLAVPTGPGEDSLGLFVAGAKAAKWNAPGTAYGGTFGALDVDLGREGKYRLRFTSRDFAAALAGTGAELDETGLAIGRGTALQLGRDFGPHLDAMGGRYIVAERDTYEPDDDAAHALGTSRPCYGFAPNDPAGGEVLRFPCEVDDLGATKAGDTASDDRKADDGTAEFFAALDEARKAAEAEAATPPPPVTVPTVRNARDSLPALDAYRAQALAPKELPRGVELFKVWDKILSAAGLAVIQHGIVVANAATANWTPPGEDPDAPHGALAVTYPDRRAVQFRFTNDDFAEAMDANKEEALYLPPDSHGPFRDGAGKCYITAQRCRVHNVTPPELEGKGDPYLQIDVAAITGKWTPTTSALAKWDRGTAYYCEVADLNADPTKATPSSTPPASTATEPPDPLAHVAVCPACGWIHNPDLTLWRNPHTGKEYRFDPKPTADGKAANGFDTIKMLHENTAAIHAGKPPPNTTIRRDFAKSAITSEKFLALYHGGGRGGAPTIERPKEK